MQTEAIDLNDGTHSRFNPDHYNQCQTCYEDHLDFEQEQAIDAQYEQEEQEEN